MTAGQWLPDPQRRHEYRYHDGQTWTADVADQGVSSTDPWPTAPSGKVQAGEAVRRFGGGVDKQMKDAAKRVVRRDSQLPADELRMLDSEPSSSLLGQWSGLASAVTKYGVSVSGVVGGSELLGILHAVSGSEDAQGRLLRNIDAKVDALVKGPYNTGRTHLLEARRLDVGDPRQYSHIEDAKNCFYQAHGQAASVQSRSLVEYHLGLTWLLLGRREDAVHWFALSHGSAMAVAHELADRTGNIKVLHSRGTTAAAAYFYPAGLVVLGRKFQKLVAAQRARDMLNDFLPFVACTARSHNSVANGASDELQALQLVHVAEDRYELSAVWISSEAAA